MLGSLTLGGFALQVFLPLSEKLISGRNVKAPSHRVRDSLPTLRLVSRESVSAEVQELVLQPELPGPGYIGSMNITGAIMGWSLPKTETPVQNEVRLDSPICCAHFYEDLLVRFDSADLFE